MTLLEVNGLTVRFGTGDQALTAVDDVSFEVAEGEVLGLVGESGSGKSTLARALAGIVPVKAGQILLDGQPIGTLRRSQRRAGRRVVQMIFQDPYSSLNPRMSVRETLSEALAASGQGRSGDRDDEIMRLLSSVGLDTGYADSVPSLLSGGERQRVAIARALATKPRVLIADEVTSSLDVSIQAQIFNLLADLIKQQRLTVIFISHNLAVVRLISDRLAVMLSGSLVEVAPVDQMVSNPCHPYTKALLASVPTIGASPGQRPESDELLNGDPPDPRRPPPGCRLHPRCPVGPVALPDRELCRTSDPRVSAASRLHRCACHFAAEWQPDTAGAAK
jgi:peptide/nickel transport system ATP-binding protein